MTASDHLGPQFSVEDETLHVGGKPFPFAQHTGTQHGTGHTEGVSWHTWHIPFESGHQLIVSGDFDQEGNNVSPYGGPQAGFREGLHAISHHGLTGVSNDFKSRHSGRGVSLVSIKTADEFHERMREIGELPGGSESHR